MADKPADKKAAPKPAPASLESKIVMFGGVALMILLIIVPAILAFFNVDSASIFNLHNIKEFFITIISKTFVFITFVAIFLSMCFFLAISYSKGKYNRVMDTWKRTVASQMPGVVNANGGPAPVSTGAVIGSVVLPGSEGKAGLAGQAAVHGPEAQWGNAVWLEVEQKINSVNPSDWRLAIIEADVLLDEMLEQMGLPGDHLGERLKAANKSFFNTLDEAWQAHKVRNIIAHQGASYQLSYNEAKKTVDLYRRVFEEFYFI